ncbi:MAG TPA: DUF5666 domain-containing protein [Candidatus Dormibacteraeota bacterium]
MKRTLSPLLLPLLVAAFACGGSANAANTPKASPSPGRQFRNGASGQLVKITGMTLILSGANGDTTVTYDSSTRFLKNSTAALGDIQPGTCILATGQKDASGAITAATVRLTPSTNGSCAGPGGGGAGQPGPGGFGGFRSPRPGEPSPNPNFGFAAGLVTAVNGTQITIKPLGTGASAIVVPTTVQVSRTVGASASDLQIGECLSAAGQRDSSGTVHANALTISPPSANGTCSRGRGFFGGFGGGGGGGFFGGGGG